MDAKANKPVSVQTQLFQQTRNELLFQGYKETAVTVSAGKANLMVLVTSLPIAVAFYLLYLWLHGSFTWFAKASVEFLVFFLVFLCGIAIHELIHGITFSTFCKKKWQSIRFGVIWKFLTPYCTCSEGLPQKAYTLGLLMPTILLGVLPYLVSLTIGNHYLMLFSLAMLLGGGGDIYLTWKIRKMKHALIIDHPDSIGCVAFEKK